MKGSARLRRLIAAFLGKEPTLPQEPREAPTQFLGDDGSGPTRRIPRAAEVDEARPPFRDTHPTRNGQLPEWAQAEPDAGVEPARLGRYILGPLLGRGGMGEVHLAFDPSLGRLLALKRMFGGDPELMRRFLREARAQAIVRHPNICEIYEVGEDGERPYIAMEFIAGRSFDAAAADLTLEEKVAVMAAVARAIHAAHGQGFIHRDLKPANIMLAATEEGPKPYVMDFGLAQDQEAPGLTVTGTVMGTPSYMAPEQVRGESRNMGPRTDVYGLGATLFAVLLGRPPFLGASNAEILTKVLDEEAPRPRSVDPALPSALEIILLKCLEKDAEHRYPSALALAEDLGRYLERQAIEAKRMRLALRVRKWVLKRKALSAALAALVLSASVLGGITLHTRLQARAQQVFAQRMGEEVRSIESLLRIAHLLPAHDLRPATAQVRQRMAGIERRLGSEGRAVRGPGAYALGRGHMALGEWPEARTQLQKAWDLGYREPEVSYALGRTLGELYWQGLAEIRGIEDPAARQQRTAALQASLKTPALQHLRLAAREARLEVPAFAEALVAFFEDAYPLALEKAQEAFRSAPWMYEALILEGEVHHKQAEALWEQGRKGPALGELEAARRAFQAAQAVARSHPVPFEREAWMRIRALNWGAPETGLKPIDRLAGLALAVAPDHIEPYRIRAWVATHLADQALLQNQDPRPQLQRSAAFIRQALDLAPRQQRFLWTLAGNNHFQQGEYEQNHGLDPCATLDAAIDAFRRALQQEDATTGKFENWAPEDAHVMVAASFLNKAVYLREHGREAEEALQAGIGAARTALRLNPAKLRAHAQLAYLLFEEGDARLEQGADPLPAWQEGVACFERVLQQNPSASETLADLAGRHQQWASYDLEHGRDPMTHCTEGLRLIEASLKGDDRSGLSFNILGGLQTVRAAWAITQGEPSAPWISKALRAFQESRTRDPLYRAQAFLGEGRVHLVVAQGQTLAGADPRPPLREARQAFAEALKRLPGAPEALAGQAEAALLEARNPTLTPSEARRALQQARPSLGALPNARRALLDAEAELLEGRLALRSGQSPQPHLERAEALLKAARTHPDRAAGLKAEVHLLRARWKATPPAVAKLELVAARTELAEATRLNPNRLREWRVLERELEALPR